MQDEIKVILNSGQEYVSPAENLDNIRRIHAGNIKKIIPLGDTKVTASKGKRATN